MGRLPATHSTVVSLWRDRLNIDYQLTLADLSFTEFASLTNCLEKASAGFEVKAISVEVPIRSETADGLK